MESKVNSYTVWDFVNNINITDGNFGSSMVTTKGLVFSAILDFHGRVIRIVAVSTNPINEAQRIVYGDKALEEEQQGEIRR